MLSRWPIRYKLLFCIGLLLLIVSTLACIGFRGVLAYRQLARSISRRSDELPLTANITQSVGQLRDLFTELESSSDMSLIGSHKSASHSLDRQLFDDRVAKVRHDLRLYSDQLHQVQPGDPRITDKEDEVATVKLIEDRLDHIVAEMQTRWFLESDLETVHADLKRLTDLSNNLPGHLQARMTAFAGKVRGQYHTWFALVSVTSILAGLLLLLLLQLLYAWVIKPLRIMIHGSRRVARGDFDYRVHLNTHDEVSELAEAMNAMTARFQEIKQDLDEKVKLRTKEVVRSEHLASVGFLAAGVAHEINNPLASVAWCAESLESRLKDIICQDEEKPDGQHNAEIEVLKKYLRTIQEEAFRCKDITEQLLDFSRMGEAERESTNIPELVEGVIEMVQRLGKYRQKKIEFSGEASIMASVNAQEIKQVMLNLITNALDSLDSGGTVSVGVSRVSNLAEIIVRDDGCGMTKEVRDHLFEPFFTRRRDGQGTGLGLSITYGIVTDHGGDITADSDGPGCGSRFRVTLPLVQSQFENDQQKQAA